MGTKPTGDEPPPVPEAGGRDARTRVLAYHERSKHHLHRYARSLGFMDWANQPDPFRRYTGAPAIPLKPCADRLVTPFGDLFVPGAVAPRPLDLGAIGLLFELALGLSAWKQFQKTRWALRCNPSSGNLHPTEGYAIVPKLPGLEAGVYHYDSHGHRLEQRAAFHDTDPLAEVLGPRTFLVGLATIAWREAWKYGERAFRYCQHDAGHALAAMRYAAAAQGWSARLLDGLADDVLAAWFGLDREGDFAGLDPADREWPTAVLLVGAPPLDSEVDAEQLGAAIRSGAWSGRPNRLSPTHVAWPVIDDVAAATTKPQALRSEAVAGAPALLPLPLPLPSFTASCRTRAATLIRQRRSCLGLDGRTPITAPTLYAMLDRLLPRPGVPPWDMLTWAPLVHLGLFIHRVDGLPPGFYLFERDAAVDARLRAAVRRRFAWTRPAGVPAHLPLVLLGRGDLRDRARVVSCHQEIAADGAFSLGMIADFGGVIRARGPWWYRHLFWEAGILGQVLYLEAEAAGVRGTGIGCYFDDAFHDLLGLEDDSFQDLYHFTIGGPVDDPRLTTLPPYAHLR
jgi:SagB-type dehydrogenase family enzyme